MRCAQLRAWPVRSCPLWLFLVLCLPVAALAQPPRGLSGTVLDPDGKAVVNAAVVVRNEATGVVRTVVTLMAGRSVSVSLTVGVGTR
jgi:hypothetical protein